MPRRKNVAEVCVREHLERDGWEVLSRGWPDYLAIRGDQVRFIEVKPDRNRRGLAPGQRRIAAALKSFGITVECMRPGDCR